MVSIEKSQMDHNDSDAEDRKEHYLSVWSPVLTIIHGYKLSVSVCVRGLRNYKRQTVLLNTLTYSL